MVKSVLLQKDWLLWIKLKTQEITESRRENNRNAVQVESHLQSDC